MTGSGANLFQLAAGASEFSSRGNINSDWQWEQLFEKRNTRVRTPQHRRMANFAFLRGSVATSVSSVPIMLSKAIPISPNDVEAKTSSANNLIRNTRSCLQFCVMSVLSSAKTAAAVNIVLAIERAHNDDEPRELIRLLEEMRGMKFCRVRTYARVRHLRLLTCARSW